jgi:hypothetical protein
MRTEPSGGASGQASDIAIHAKEILRVRRVLTEIYQRHCGQDGEAAEAGLQRFGTHRVSVNLAGVADGAGRDGAGARLLHDRAGGHVVRDRGQHPREAAGAGGLGGTEVGYLHLLIDLLVLNRVFWNIAKTATTLLYFHLCSR